MIGVRVANISSGLIVFSSTSPTQTHLAYRASSVPVSPTDDGITGENIEWDNSLSLSLSSFSLQICALINGARFSNMAAFKFVWHLYNALYYAPVACTIIAAFNACYLKKKRQRWWKLGAVCFYLKWPASGFDKTRVCSTSCFVCSLDFCSNLSKASTRLVRLAFLRFFVLFSVNWWNWEFSWIIECFSFDS